MLLSHKISFKWLGALHRYSLNNSVEVGDLKGKKKRKKKEREEAVM